MSTVEEEFDELLFVHMLESDAQPSQPGENAAIITLPLSVSPDMLSKYRSGMAKKKKNWPGKRRPVTPLSEDLKLRKLLNATYMMMYKQNPSLARRTINHHHWDVEGEHSD